MVRVGGLDAQALADASLQTARAAEEEHAGRLGAGEPGGAIYLVPPLVVAFAGSPAVEQIVSHSVEEEHFGPVSLQALAHAPEEARPAFLV